MVGRTGLIFKALSQNICLSVLKWADSLMFINVKSSLSLSMNIY